MANPQSWFTKHPKWGCLSQSLGRVIPPAIAGRLECMVNNTNYRNTPPRFARPEVSGELDLQQLLEYMQVVVIETVTDKECVI